MSESSTLLISQIRTDGGTQSRAELNNAVIEEYAEAMRAGITFPPLTVFYDGAEYWLADGFHRIAAAGGAELDRVAVEIRQGTREDAQWHSYGANQEHGLRRSNADKQRAAQAALKHPNSGALSDREISRHIGVSPSFVSQWRQKLSVHGGQIDPPKKRTVSRAGVTYQQNVANIGLKSTSRRPQSHQKVNEGDGAPTPGTEAGSPAITVCPSTGEADRPKPRTYVPDRQSAPDIEPMSMPPEDESAIEGIAGAVEMIVASKRIKRVRLTANERRYIAADKAGLQIMRDARNALDEEIRIAESESFAEVA